MRKPHGPLLLATLVVLPVLLAGCTFEPLPDRWVPPKDFTPPPAPPPFTLRLEEGAPPALVTGNGTANLTLLIGPNATHAGRAVRLAWSLRDGATNRSVEAVAAGLRLQFTPTRPLLNATAEVPVALRVTAKDAAPAAYSVEIEAILVGEDTRVRHAFTFPLVVREA